MYVCIVYTFFLFFITFIKSFLENVKSTPAARQKKSIAEKVLENVNPEVITEYDNAVDKATLDKMIIGSDNFFFGSSNLTTLDKHVKKHSLQ